MAETAKQTIARLRRELRTFKRQFNVASERLDDARGIARDAMASSKHWMLQAEKRSKRINQLEGYIARVREEDAARRGDPIPSAVTVDRIKEVFTPEQIVDIGLGADEDDLGGEQGRGDADALFP